MAVGSVRSCGVSTLALALAATWPAGRRVLLVEADSAGGTLAAASGWPPEPGLVSLAAAARRGGDPRLVWEHCHSLPGGAAVVAGPALAEQARSTLGLLVPLLGRLGELDADVIVDCGRLDPGSPSMVLWKGADQPLLAVRPRLADLQAVASWLDGRSLDRQVGAVTVGDGPYPDAEIADALGLEVAARLPWDPDAANALVAMPASARQVRLAPLVRATRTLADQLARGLTEAASVAEVRPDAETTAHGRGVTVRSRVLRAWRPDTRPHPNGNVPEEASR